MDKIQRFCDELTTCYAEHHLSPSLILSSVPDRKNKGQRIGYAAVHTFPNGLASRNIVCKGSGPSVEAALDQCIEIWVGMQALLTNTPPVTDADGATL